MTDTPHSAPGAAGPWGRSTEPPPPPDPTQPAGRMTFRGAPATVAILVTIVAIELFLTLDPALRNEAIRRFAFWPVVVPAVLLEGASPIYLGQLLSHVLLHGGLLHVGFNAAALAALGPPVERMSGTLGYLLLFALAGVAGALAHMGWAMGESAILGGGSDWMRAPLVGASGAICGVLGFDLRRRALALARMPANLRPYPPGQWLWRASSGFVLINVLISLAGAFISGAAHLGGFAVGLLLAPWLLRRSDRLDDWAARP